jgi:hypothetical protein
MVPACVVGMPRGTSSSVMSAPFCRNAARFGPAAP